MTTEKIRNDPKTYQWVIGLLVGLLVFMMGWFTRPASCDQKARDQITQTETILSKRDADLERRIAVLENIAITNQQNIAYIRQAQDEIKSILLKK